MSSFEIERVSDTDRWEYNRTSAPWPVGDRDFVIRTLVSHVKRPEFTLTISMNSAENPKQPLIDGVVRGALTDSKFVLVEKGKRSTLFICEVLVDPKGDVPVWVVNNFQKDWPLDTIRGLRAHLKKARVPESPTVVRWMRAK